MSGKYDCLLLENQLCFPLYACAKEIVRQYRKPLEPLGLTYTQYIVMMALWESGDMAENELGNRVHLDSGTLTPLLKRLEKQGLIDRKRSLSDERRLLVSLSEKGKALRQQAVHVPAAMQGCVQLSEEEAMQLKQLLNKALGNMNR